MVSPLAMVFYFGCVALGVWHGFVAEAGSCASGFFGLTWVGGIGILVGW